MFMRDDFDILMVTHAELSKGYFSALKLILDIDEADLETVSFEEGEPLDTFSEKLNVIIEDKHKSRNMVILVDLPGGTPANMAAPFMSESRKLVAGVNLPFVLELMIAKKSGTSWDELNIDSIINNAKNSLVFYNKLL